MRQSFCKGLGIIKNGLIKITCIGIQFFELGICSLNDLGMRVADMLYVIYSIKIFVTRLIIKILPFASNKMQWVLVGQA